MTYKLYTDGPGFLLMDANDQANAITIPDHQHLIQINARIMDYVNTASADGPAAMTVAGRELTQIGTVEARRLAKAEGYNINTSTIHYALKSGNIFGARQIGSRWTMPKWAWVEWFNHWKADRVPDTVLEITPVTVE